MTAQPIRRALISVSDKTGLADFGRALAEQGVTLISTGGTARALRDAGLEVTEVSALTGQPEILDGRVKTLHPLIHGGILARRDLPEHSRDMAEHGIPAIDLVAIDLYPFEATLSSGADFATCIENIDIGGPAMIRAAAKNHQHVTVVTDPADYASVTAALSAHGGELPGDLRRQLAAKAFARTATYDAAIANWLSEQTADPYPQQMALPLSRQQRLRYGENPHQSAAFYAGGFTPAERDRPGVGTAEQLQGKELSYNNITDTDAAYELVAEFSDPAVVIVKHANPCGAAVAADLTTAYRRALRCDPISAFGGIIAVNRPLDAATAEVITEIFAEVIIAPEIAEAAKPVLARKKALRVLAAGALPDPLARGRSLKTVAGGVLVQDRDFGRIGEADLTTVTQRDPDRRELADLLFAFTVCKHVRSNAVVYARDGATVAIGAGQMSRVDSCRIAAEKGARAAEQAGESQRLTEGSVVASDAFFPFPDGLVTAAEAGVTAVIQPGGSRKDQDVIAAADARNLAMVMTGVRHFRH